jgi:methyl-accepting chemotaxis protein
MLYFNNLTKLAVSRRLALISAAYVLPMAVLLYSLTATINESIHFAELEQAGNQFQRPLMELLWDTIEYGGLAEEAKSPDEKKIEQDIDALEVAYQTWGEQLQFTPAGLAMRQRSHLTVEEVRKEWSMFRGAIAKKSSSEVTDSRKRLVTLIRGMITHMGDTSNLILDPDLDSYYVMDATLLAIPQLQERLFNISNTTAALKTESELSKADQIQAAVFAATLQESDLIRIKGDFETAFNEDENFNGVSNSLKDQVSPRLESLLNSGNDMFSTLENISESQTIQDEQQRDFKSGIESTLQSSKELWLAAATELDQLLTTRISGHVLRKWIMLGAFAGALLLSFVWVFIVNSSITRPLEKALRSLAQGGSALQTVTQQMTQSSDSLQLATTQQAAAVQQTAAAMAEIGSMVARTQECASEAVSASRDVSMQVEVGRDTMDQLVDSMNQIKESNSRLNEMSEIIGDIANKTVIINDIVFKTQLLSFNASIEAARAGQHGRGFAVVAEEVGNLAEMSGAAAKEIQSLLNRSHSQVGNLIEMTQTKISRSEVVTARALKAFATISESVEKIAEYMGQINDAMREQATGIDQTSESMKDMDHSAQLNASVAVESVKVVTKLNDQGTTIGRVIGGLSELIRGEA